MSIDDRATAYYERGDKRLASLFMCDTTERYALLLRCGLSREQVLRMDLARAPSSCVLEVVSFLIRERFTDEQFETFFARVELQPMPGNIPEVLD
jgi:hypothetical protein